MSTAGWAPPHSGRPLATTSNRRSSRRSTGRLRSARRVLEVPWQTRAAARSRAHPWLRRTPDVEHAARWSPRGSKRRWHRHVFSVTGSGRRRRRSKTVRNKCEGAVSSGIVGRAARILLANGLCRDSSRATAAGSRPALKNPVLNGSSRLPLPPVTKRAVTLVKESEGLGNPREAQARMAGASGGHTRRGGCG